MNDKMYWAYKECKLNKDEFGIIGEIHHFYNLRTVKIPMQPTDGEIVFKFVETLLTIRVCEMQFLFKFLFHLT